MSRSPAPSADVAMYILSLLLLLAARRCVAAAASSSPDLDRPPESATSDPRPDWPGPPRLPPAPSHGARRADGDGDGGGLLPDDYGRDYPEGARDYYYRGDDDYDDDDGAVPPVDGREAAPEDVYRELVAPASGGARMDYRRHHVHRTLQDLIADCSSYPKVFKVTTLYLVIVDRFTLMDAVEIQLLEDLFTKVMNDCKGACVEVLSVTVTYQEAQEFVSFEDVALDGDQWIGADGPGRSLQQQEQYEQHGRQTQARRNRTRRRRLIVKLEVEVMCRGCEGNPLIADRRRRHRRTAEGYGSHRHLQSCADQLAGALSGSGYPDFECVSAALLSPDDPRCE